MEHNRWERIGSKKFIIGVFLLLLLSLLCFWHLGRDGTTKDWDELIDQVNDHNKAELDNVVDIQQYAQEDNETASFTKEELYQLFSGKDYGGDGALMTKESAINDVNTLMQCLKVGYGAYIYFGGDQAFESAREQAIAEINLRNEAEISSKELTNILLDVMSFVRDRHFLIHKINPAGESESLYSTQVYKKEGEDFYALSGEMSGEKITSINSSEQVEQWMKQSVSDEGKLVYRIVKNQVSQKSMSISILYEDKKTEQVKLMSRTSTFNVTEPAVANSKIPTVTFKSFERMSISDKQIKELQESPMIIVDVRGNPGGDPDVLDEFLTKLDPQMKGIALGSGRIIRNTRFAQLNWICLSPESYEQGEKERFIENYSSMESGPDEIEEGNSRFISSNQITFVLTDEKTCSTAEDAVLSFKMRQNTIVVGTHTAGGVIGSEGVISLPNSSIEVRVGMALTLFNNALNDEINGIQPDIVVNGDAMAAVYQMIDCYQLDNK